MSMIIHLEIIIYFLYLRAHIKQGLYTRELGNNTWFRIITNIEYLKFKKNSNREEQYHIPISKRQRCSYGCKYV